MMDDTGDAVEENIWLRVGWEVNNNFLFPSGYCNQLHSSGSSLRVRLRFLSLSSQSLFFSSDLYVSQCQMLPTSPLSFLA